MADPLSTACTFKKKKTFSEAFLSHSEKKSFLVGFLAFIFFVAEKKETL